MEWHPVNKMVEGKNKAMVSTRGEQGIALVTVLLGSLAALALAMAMVTFATGSLSSSQREEAYSASLAGAEAGIDEYLYRLNSDTNYWQKGLAGGTPPSGSPYTGFQPVPGGNTNETFRYEVTDAPSVANKGRLTIKVVAKSRNSTRTVKAQLRRESFVDFLYFTNYETKDPDLYVKAPAGSDAFTPVEARTVCERYKWASPPRDPQCSTISFTQFDQVNGPLHTNDTLRISTNLNGWPRFNGDTSSEKPTAPRYELIGSGRPYFVNGWTGATPPGADPKFKSHVEPPRTNSALKAKTKIGVPGTGCLYTGPTRIWLVPTGGWRVVSPLTRSTTVGCGPVNGSATVTGPADFNGVVYVQSVPALSTDPNFPIATPNCNTTGWYPSINYPAAYLPLPGGGTTGPSVPMANDVTTYKCRDGDVFIQGTLKGQLTIGAENNIVVTDDVRYEGVASPYKVIPASNTNLLGLIANNFVEVFHPVNTSGANLTTDLNNLTIHAAIFGVARSFRVQRHNSGAPMGTLLIVGAIAQKFRGFVSTFNNSTGAIVTGYAKDYNYDNRLQLVSPPHFLDPVESAWKVQAWSEVKN